MLAEIAIAHGTTGAECGLAMMRAAIDGLAEGETDEATQLWCVRCATNAVQCGHQDSIASAVLGTVRNGAITVSRTWARDAAWILHRHSASRAEAADAALDVLTQTNPPLRRSIDDVSGDIPDHIHTAIDATCAAVALLHVLRAGDDTAAAFKDLDVLDALIADHASAEEHGWGELRVVAKAIRGKLCDAPGEAWDHFNKALAAANEAIDIEKRRLDGVPADSDDAQELLEGLDASMSLRVALCVDLAQTLSDLELHDEAIRSLDQAEGTLRSAPSIASEDDAAAKDHALRHDARFADILLRRAMVFDAGGDHKSAAEIARNAFNVMRQAAPGKLDDLATLCGIQERWFDSMHQGARTIEVYAEFLEHVKEFGDDNDVDVAESQEWILLKQLSLLDARGESEAVLRMFEDEGADLAEMLRENALTPGARTTALSHEVKALAVAGRTTEAAAVLASARRAANEHDEDPVALKFTEATIAVGTGDEERGLRLWREAVDLAHREDDGNDVDEASCYVDAANIAAACALEGACDSSRVSELLQKARRLADDDRDYCMKAASVLFHCGRHVEAVAMAREMLQGTQPDFASVDTPVDAVPACILLLEDVRTTEAASGRLVAAALAAIGVLRKDGREQLAGRFARALQDLASARP